ncbi:MAG: zinc finger Ran-binding domain-containing protein [Lentisphaeria bacterium]|nr:zinc finger Ran-binding domain-containing protein [Lentisphaeria bacterium]
MKSRFFTVFSVGVLAACLAGCGAKDPDKEIKKFDEAKSRAEQTVAVNQAFARVLDAEIGAADAACERAKSIADSKAKAKAIRQAAGMLRGGTFQLLDDVKRKIQRAGDLSLRYTSKGATLTELATANQAAELARQAISHAEMVLRDGATDAAAAKAKLNEADAKLSAVIQSLEKLLRQMARTEKNVSATPRPPESSSTGKTTVTPPPAPVAQEWTCAYCGGKNKPATVKCVNCGAAKK